jgi:hypothetical protein
MVANVHVITEKEPESVALKRVEETRENVERLVDSANKPLVQGPLLTGGLARQLVDVKINQGAEDVDELRAMALRVIPAHNRVTEEVAETGGGRATIASELKDEDRMREKYGDQYESAHKKIGDVVRTSIIFDDLGSLYRAVIKLYETVEIIRVKDRFINPRPSGYRDLLFNIRLEDPETGKDHITEVQFQLAAIHNVRKEEHTLYRKRRTLEQECDLYLKQNPGDEAGVEELRREISRLEGESSEIFEEAWKPYEGSFDEYEEYKGALPS